MQLKPNGMDQGSLHQYLLALATRALSTPALATAAAATIAVGSTFTYSIAGKLYSKASGTLTLTTAVSTGASEFRKCRIEIDAAGTYSVIPGTIAAAQALAAVPMKSGADKATVGWFEVPASFTGGTTNTNVAGFAVYSGDPDLGDSSILGAVHRGIEQRVLTS
jgi:hypothetical protein